MTFLRRPTRAVLVIGPYLVLQRCDVEAKDQFLALNLVMLAAPYRDVPLVTAVIAVWLTRRRAHIRHGVIVFRSGPISPARCSRMEPNLPQGFARSACGGELVPDDIRACVRGHLVHLDRRSVCGVGGAGDLHDRRARGAGAFRFPQSVACGRGGPRGTDPGRVRLRLAGRRCRRGRCRAARSLSAGDGRRRP